MTSNRALLGFIALVLVLLLAVSLGATHAVASFFIPQDGLAWAFAFGIELGIVGLGVGIFQSIKSNQDPRAFTYTLIAVLTISTLANFLHGADSFNGAYALFDQIKNWKLWWLLPLVFVAPIPILLFRLTELITRMWLETWRTTNPTNATSENGKLPFSSTGTTSLSTGTTNLAPATATGLPVLVIQIIRIYQEQPATPLPKLAELLEVSATEASRLRLQAMQMGLLERKARGYYLPAVPPERLLALPAQAGAGSDTADNGNGNGHKG